MYLYKDQEGYRKEFSYMYLSEKNLVPLTGIQMYADKYNKTAALLNNQQTTTVDLDVWPGEGS